MPSHRNCDHGRSPIPCLPTCTWSTVRSIYLPGIMLMGFPLNLNCPPTDMRVPKRRSGLPAIIEMNT